MTHTEANILAETEFIKPVTLTCTQIFTLRGISFTDAITHPAYHYTKTTRHHNLNGSVDVEEAVFFHASDSPTRRLWVVSRHTNIPNHVERGLVLS